MSVTPAEAVPVERRLGFGVGFALCAAYAAVDLLSRWLAGAPLSVAPWYPQAAIAAALIVGGGIGYAPAIIVAAMVAEWVAPVGGPFAVEDVLTAAGSAAGHCIAGFILARLSHWRRGELSLHDVTWLVVAGICGSVAGSLAGALARLGGEAGSFMGYAEVWGSYAIGNLLGLVVPGPLLMMLIKPGQLMALQHDTATLRTVTRDLFAFCVTLAAILLLVFALKPFDEFRMFYLMFLPMIAVSMRYGLAGAALALPLVQLGLIVALAVFSSRAATALEFQLLMLVLALTSLYLGAVTDEKRRSALLLAQGQRQLREQRDALSEAQRTAATAELAAAVAHDLNQPLSAIGTYAKACHLMIERGEADRADILRTLDQLSAESARAGQYVLRMRDFFRSGVLRDERVDTRRVIETAHAHLRDRLEREGIVWRDSFDPDLPAARGDAVQVAAILDNLLVNACDALQGVAGSRWIRVAVTHQKHASPPTVRVSVEDSGAGIAPEMREQLFKPLATSKPHGMGLGLALSRSIAERLGGRLWLADDAPQTMFCLELLADR